MNRNLNLMDCSIGDLHWKSILTLYEEMITKKYINKEINREELCSLSQDKEKVCEEIKFALNRKALPYLDEMMKTTQKVVSDFLKENGVFNKDSSVHLLTTKMRDENQEEGEFLEYVIDKKTGDVRFIDNPEFMRRL